MGSTEEPKPIIESVFEYDSNQVKSLLKAQLMGVGMMAVMHLYFKYTNPLLIQSIIPLKGAFECNEVLIHVFGKPAIGDLKRPFKASEGFMSQFAGGAAPAQDKKSIEMKFHEDGEIGNTAWSTRLITNRPSSRIVQLNYRPNGK